MLRLLLVGWVRLDGSPLDSFRQLGSDGSWGESLGDTETGYLRWLPHSCVWCLSWDNRNSWRLVEHLYLHTVSLCWASSQNHSIRVVGLLTWLLAPLKLVFWETKASCDLASLLLHPIGHYMQPSLMWKGTTEECAYCEIRFIVRWRASLQTSYCRWRNQCSDRLCNMPKNKLTVSV